MDIMNGWFITIIGFIIASWLVETILAITNIKAQPNQLPPEFQDIYTPEKYNEAVQYQKTTTYFSLLEKGTSTLLLLFFLMTGGFNWVDTVARSYELGEITTGLIFVGIVSLLSFIVSLPFQFYSTFVIEERFGFNKTTLRTFFLDTLKGGLLSLLLVAPLLTGILWFLGSSGSLAWLYCWATTLLFTFVIQLLAPVFIMPLFNTFTPLQEGPLKARISTYAKDQNFTLQGIFTMDGSKRSSKLNAFFTGFGKLKKVVLFDTLVEKLHTDEIVAVLAHEVGHAKLNHIYKGLGIFVIQSGIIFYLISFSIAQPGFTHAFGMQTPSNYATLFFFGILFSPVSMFLSIYYNALSRKHEFEADSFAAKSTCTSRALISALKKLTEENLGNLSPHPLYVLFYYSHPPLRQRINRLENISHSNNLQN